MCYAVNQLTSGLVQLSFLKMQTVVQASVTEDSMDKQMGVLCLYFLLWFSFQVEISAHNSEEMVLSEDDYVLWAQERITRYWPLESAAWWVFSVVFFEIIFFVKINWGDI